MDPRTRALAVDFSLAAGATAVGVLWSTGPLRWLAVVALVGCVALVSPLAVVEQTSALDLVAAYSPASYLAAFVLALAVGLVVVVGRTVLASPSATLLGGMGLGLAAYRFVYGVVEPVPDRRVAQARQFEFGRR